MAIDKTILQYKELFQLQEFAQAQMTTIMQISKKIQRLEDERDHLKQLLESSVPLIKTSPDGVIRNAQEDSEYICTIEIAKLKNITQERELTYEETRKLSEYFKILSQINSKSPTKEKEVKELSTEKLLQLIDGEKKSE